MNEAIAEYRRLRDRMDERSRELVDCHGQNIVCRAGCCDCCTNLTVFPVEYYSILDQLRQAGVTHLSFDQSASCGFLRDKLCTLYASRPLICRTHGLPIAFLNDEIDPPEYSVSFCPLNFSETAVEDLAFGPDTTLDIDQLNTELYLINIKFLEQQPGHGWQPTSRIPLRQLCDDLAKGKTER